MRAASVKSAWWTDQPVWALTCTKQTPFSAHQVVIQVKSTSMGISFLLPSSTQLACGTLFWAIGYQLSWILCQLEGSVRPHTNTTPWHDLKQVATIDRNLSCPAVSHKQSRTSLSSSWTFLLPKSTMVAFLSESDSFLRQRQKSEVLPTPLSPTKITLYFYPSKYQSTEVIIDNKMVRQLLTATHHFVQEDLRQLSQASSRSGWMQVMKSSAKGWGGGPSTFSMASFIFHQKSGRKGWVFAGIRSMSLLI